ncbi:MAG: glycosyltransferase family 4 protein [Christensenellaceae bacterium]
MNIIFITLSRINDIDSYGIYSDLMREFAKQGNLVTIVSPVERRFNEKTHIIAYGNSDDWHKNVRILKVKTGNIQKTNIIEKGISTVLLENQITKAIKKYLKNDRFDLVLYSTPPITLVKPVSFIKKRDGAKSYLMLKDIFPQNAVDLAMMKTTGLKGLLYKFFRNKEKQLYEISDKIGCMSQANVDYVLNHNPEISSDKVEIFPNCIEIQDVSLTIEEKQEMRNKYGIPLDKKVFVYGGNLGKPQGIPFIIDCLRAEKENEEVFFLIVGDGTEYSKLEQFEKEERPKNFKLMKRLPKDDYDRMIASCDVGMIFLDHRFTIPNFPSRLLSYMQAGLPVLACTDPNTDIGKVIVEGGFGWWCESNDVKSFNSVIAECLGADLDNIGNNGYNYLLKKYSVKENYESIND